MKCIVCGRKIEDFEDLENHHVSYPVRGFPEIKVPVHKRCHSVIHNTDFYPGLRPRRGHANLYYNGEKNTAEDYVDDEIIYFKKEQKPNLYDLIREQDEIDWYKLVSNFYKYHQKNSETDDNGRPILELSPGQGKEVVKIPLTLNNLAEIFDSNKQTIGRKIKK